MGKGASDGAALGGGAALVVGVADGLPVAAVHGEPGSVRRPGKHGAIVGGADLDS